VEYEFMAFMSYAHFDDEHEAGKLSEFRNRLSGEVRFQTGKEFPRACLQTRDGGVHSLV
jgi:hypothetical protein